MFRKSREYEEIQKEKIKRRTKNVKQCVNCGNYKNLTDGETVIYTKDINLKIVTVCDAHCRKAFVKRGIEYLQNKIEWLESELVEE